MTAKVLAVLTGSAVVLTMASSAGGVSLRDRVNTSSRVTGLGVHGNHAAFALESSCDLFSWRLGAGASRAFEAATDCDSPFAFGDVGVTASEIVWSEVAEHNHLYPSIKATPLARPGPWRTTYSAIDEDIGALAAAAETIAFSTQAGPYVGGPDATLRVGSTKRVAPIARAAGWMDRIAVDRGLVALGYRDGRVRIYGASGRPLRSYSAGTATNGLALSRGDIFTLARGRLSVRSLGGRIQVSRPVHGSRVELLDARAGVVVYRSGTTLRIVRLGDGRDVSLRVPATPREYLHAAFADRGLVVAYRAAGSQSNGVVELMGWSRLEQLLAKGR
jgi:hypothetical protein